MIKGARYGCVYDGKRYHTFLFTHYNPVEHKAWADDVPVYDVNGNKVGEGFWFPYDLIKWV